MKNEIKAGSLVRLLGVPDWLIRDLPDDEIDLIMAQVGSVAVVTEIDDYGYFWLGFDRTQEDGTVAFSMSGWFSVSEEYLQRL